MRRTELVTRIARAARHLGAGPRGLLFTPVARVNPFQEILYGELWCRDIAPIAVYDTPDISMATLFHELGGRAAVHLHWTHEITRAARTEVEAADATKAFVARVRTLQDAGVKFVWTIHNRLPHECRFVDVEIDFRAQLAATADVLHVMTAAAVDELSDLYPIPTERVIVVPHPSYATAYPDYVRQPDARSRLGIEHDELVVAVLGAIRGYKQIDTLHDALRASGSRVRLLVAGDPGPQTEELIERLRADPHVTVLAKLLTDREMSEMITAADAVACIHDSPLASGTANLALTLGRAVLAPDRASSHEQYGEAAVYTTATDLEHLAQLLGGLDRADLQRRGQIARDLAAQRRSVPEAFARTIDDLLGSDQA